jgi:hypothetical protein
MLSRIAFALLALGAASPALAAPACGLGTGFDYMGVDIRRAEDASAYVYVTDEKIVDADGAPDTYYSGDARDGCPGEGRGRDCLASAGYPDESWWNEVLVRDPDDPDQPYIQPEGAYQGYFVSMTSLRNPDYAGWTSPLSYVDAATIPYLVLPAPLYRSDGMGEMGDLGFAVDLDTGRSTPFVIADEGPVEPLGEASIALWRALGANDPSPRTGAGLPPGQVAYVVFPGSGEEAQLDWPLEVAEVKEKAAELLDSFGGRGRLLACASEDEDGGEGSTADAL